MSGYPLIVLEAQFFDLNGNPLAGHGLGAITQRVGDRARGDREAMRSIRRHPALSAEQKREQMDTLQSEQNRLFRDAVRALSAAELTRYRDALEGTQSDPAVSATRARAAQ